MTRNTGSIRFIVDLANIIRQDGWIWREGGRWARVTASCCICSCGIGPQTTEYTHTHTHAHVHLQLVMNKGNNLRPCCKSDDIPIIGKWHHRMTVHLCVTVSFRKWCIILISNPVIFHRHQIWGHPFFIAPSTFNWLSLRTLFLQLVSNDSGFPATTEALRQLHLHVGKHPPPLLPSAYLPDAQRPVLRSHWEHPTGMFVFGSQGCQTVGVSPIWSKGKWAEILVSEGMPNVINMNRGSLGASKNTTVLGSMVFLADTSG